MNAERRKQAEDCTPVKEADMTDRELHRLSRKELLDLLIQQSKETKNLQERLDAAEEQLASRRIEVENAGSIAEASLRLNGVFQAAQEAADQYLENVRQRAEAAQ
jgi:hypothetical protein